MKNLTQVLTSNRYKPAILPEILHYLANKLILNRIKLKLSNLFINSILEIFIVSFYRSNLAW